MINVLVLAGRLTKDVELQYTPGGDPIAKFSLAVDRQFKREGGQEADFFNCVAFKKTAENVSQYCGKGSRIAVEGRVEIDRVEKDGRTNYYTNVIASSVRFLETKAEADARRGGEAPASRPAPAPAQAPIGETEDPFA